MPARLLVLRHGESEGNAARILQGHFDTRLSELGRAQARLTADALVAQGIDGIFASPLARASETASIIGQRLGLPLHHHDGLMEYDMGEVSGKTWPQIRDEYAHLFDAAVDGARPSFPGEEGRPQFALRVRNVLDELRTRDGTTLVVTHGGVIGAMCHIAIGLEYVEGSRFSAANCSITEFRAAPRGNGLVLHRANDACHLAGIATAADLG